jgi:hypothetical protein
MTMVKDKQLPYSNITPELVDEAYPGLLGNWKKEIRPVPPAPWQGVSPMQAPSPEVLKMREHPIHDWNVDVCEVKPSDPPKEKKPTSPKKLAAMEKARATRRANLAAKKAVEGK